MLLIAVGGFVGELLHRGQRVADIGHRAVGGLQQPAGVVGVGGRLA